MFLGSDIISVIRRKLCNELQQS